MHPNTTNSPDKLHVLPCQHHRYSMQAGVKDEEKLAARLPLLRVPTLIIHGTFPLRP